MIKKDKKYIGRYEYALYYKDRFVDVGTAEEIAKRQNLSLETVYWYGSSVARRRKSNFLLFKLEKDNDEEEV